MCLTLRENCNKPYNKSDIRYKFLYRRKNYKSLYSVHKQTRYTIGKWKVANADEINLEIKDTESYHRRFGIHVFISKLDASKKKWGGDYIVVKMQVSGFLKSGTFGDYRSETWRRAKIIKIYD